MAMFLWDIHSGEKEFSEAFINQVEAVRESGIYNNCYWEILVKG